MNSLPSLLLVVATAAIGLGLAAVTASLASLEAGVDRDARDWRQMGMSRQLALAVEFAESDVALARGSAAPGTPSRMPNRAALPLLSAGPWVSPLYPQNGVTLWDRIRVSSQRDRRAFLLGTAIQVHASAIAATPGP